MICFTAYDSPLGVYYLAGEETTLFGVWLHGQRHFSLQELKGNAVCRETALLRQTKVWLDRYFSGERLTPGELPLSPQGTPFQRQIWKALLQIPYGSVTTYGALAKTVGEELGQDRLAPQAVGSAVGRNPLSILIPCHRVVGAKGALTGYAGGVEVKAWLLHHEGVTLEENRRHNGEEGWQDF